jgi:hypothetical protein
LTGSGRCTRSRSAYGQPLVKNRARLSPSETSAADHVGGDGDVLAGLDVLDAEGRWGTFDGVRWRS